MFALINENPIEWLEQYSDYLFGFAMSRLHDATVAEDLVQETLLAALQSQQKFSHGSSEKTWLTAILKHKIIDYYRRSSRQVSFASDEEESNFFDQSGHWRDEPLEWNQTPETLLERKEFQQVLQNCLASLPKNLAAVFTLSEIEGLSRQEICEILNLTPNNFWVMLHRARLQLRKLIENQWFGRTIGNSLPTQKFAFAG